MDKKDPDKGKAKMDIPDDFVSLYCDEVLEKVKDGLSGMNYEKRKLEGEPTSGQPQNEKGGKRQKEASYEKYEIGKDLKNLKEKVDRGTNAGLVNLEGGRSQNLDAGTEYMEVDTHGKSPMERGTERKSQRFTCGLCEKQTKTYAFNLHLQQTERQPNVKPMDDYLVKIQTDLNANMRAMLVDSLVTWAVLCELLPNTIYLAVSYIDRFLSVNKIKRNQLEVLGISCMLVASKYECTLPLTVRYICQTNSHLKEADVWGMEEEVLKVLNYTMGNPTVMTFLRLFKSDLRDYETPNLKLDFLAAYLAELSLLDYDCVKYFPSLIAAAVMFLARLTLEPKSHPWTMALQRSTRYKPACLRGCVLTLHDLQLGKRLGSFVSLREKYKGHEYKCVSQILPPLEIPDSYFDDVSFIQTASFDAGCAQVIQLSLKFLDRLKSNVPEKGDYNKVVKKKAGSEDDEAIVGQCQNEKAETIDTPDRQEVSDADLGKTAFASGRAQTIQLIRDFLDDLQSEVPEQSET